MRVVVDKYYIVRMDNEAPEAVHRRMKDTIGGKLNLALKRERKLLTLRQHELSDEQWPGVSGCLNSFAQLKTACNQKERYFRIWECVSSDEASAQI